VDFLGNIGLRLDGIDGHIGCIVIKPDGSSYVARAVLDPLA
jgi:hypothetical protein